MRRRQKVRLLEKPSTLATSIYEKSLKLKEAIIVWTHSCREKSLDLRQEFILKFPNLKLLRKKNVQSHRIVWNLPFHQLPPSNRKVSKILKRLWKLNLLNLKFSMESSIFIQTLKLKRSQSLKSSWKNESRIKTELYKTWSKQCLFSERTMILNTSLLKSEKPKLHFLIKMVNWQQ